MLSLEQWKELTKLERDRFLNHPNSSATADAMVHYGTMNRDDLEKMKELGLLRKWWWWWNAQVDEEVSVFPSMVESSLDYAKWLNARTD